MTLDYFYGAQADQFAFYRIPKALFTDERFKSISAEAKILYGILLDRMSLSRKNGWLDEQGRVFIIFTLEEVMEAIGCADQKATKLLNELDSKAGLIERKRQGLGKPNLIFVKNFVDNSTGSIPPAPESRIKTRENHDSADVNFTTPESRKSRGSNTDSNYTDLSETETYPFPSGQVGGHGQPPVDKMGRDMDEREQYRAILEDNLEYDILLENNPYDRDTIAEIMELLLDTICSKRQYIRIAGDDKPREVVKSQFLKLNCTHIEYVLSSFKENASKVRNIKQYLGYADKEDCKWSATTIIRILQDETYIGTLVQGKQGSPHYKIKQMEQRPSSEWIRVPDTHEPLIAKQDFELVQRIRRLDTRTSPKRDTVYLFSGVLICGCCGNRMTRKTNRVKGKEYHYYYCPTGKKHGCTNPVMLKESDLVECVKDSLKGYIDNVSCLQAILDGIDQSSINQALANEYASHIAANEQQVEQALEFKARLYESLITGTISKEEYTDYKARYTRIAENAKESIRVLKEKLADVLENRSERNRWISHFTQFSTMETLDRKAVVHMIQSIKVIGKKELEITFTYQDEYQKAIQLIQLAEQTSQRKVG